MRDKWDMSSHKNISEECIGAEQVSHQKYSCTIYDAIKYLYSVNKNNIYLGPTTIPRAPKTSIMVSE